MDNIELGRDNKTVELDDNYSVTIYGGELMIFSECCGVSVSENKAVEIVKLITEWLESRNG